MAHVSILMSCVSCPMCHRSQFGVEADSGGYKTMNHSGTPSLSKHSDERDLSQVGSGTDPARHLVLDT